MEGNIGKENAQRVRRCNKYSLVRNTAMSRFLACKAVAPVIILKL